MRLVAHPMTHENCADGFPNPSDRDVSGRLWRGCPHRAPCRNICADGSPDPSDRDVSGRSPESRPHRSMFVVIEEVNHAPYGVSDEARKWKLVYQTLIDAEKRR
jgi:hypothetical protein